ncbi:MAG: 3-oxoacyl-[acyl-carrier-protein] synthase, KASII [uncultured Thermomicrobiales bacterium]|uniref:3-oxoacyl-[acyl-carrier-protein] synthase 2 n=1 Tax=uncultured Thermomicrobiales bacterium TaxID=1645740 RepID=A0A6J4VQN7_9BACT|nr:MAG: 3-oxoacyl-[acyl-carrier-protein] synthase, KASII [uncultured Thermomicrobiales bacterium]
MGRVVVTGVGAVTPLGIGAKVSWDGLVGGRSGVRPIVGFDASDLQVRIAGEVPDFVAKDHMDAKAARRMDRFSQFAVAAAREAIEDAKLEITDANRADVAVVVNTGGGGIPTIEQNVTAMNRSGPGRVSPLLIPMFAPNMASSQVSIAFGVRGPVVTMVAACAAGVQAFVDAVHLLQRGDAEVAITGGTEGTITPVAIASMANMGALSRRNDEPERASRPFDRGRDGFVFGEGAGVMILETEEHALRRGAPVICEVAGGAYTADAYHITAPLDDGAGAALAMKRALARAGLAPEEVQYVAAHATATPLGDIAETKAIRCAFGPYADRLAVSATKSMIGHLLGAAGAVSALACVLAIRDGVVPPTINLDDPDPACDLDYVPNTARRMRVDAALANGFGFGGQNATAIFRRV